MESGIRRIAVVSEVSASDKNKDILRALSGRDFEVLNVGMSSPDGQPQINYLHTGLMTALLLNLKTVDMVIGGCGTGIGYYTSAMMYPGVFCGLVQEPLDGWLFTRINAGNCISLSLNKGWGWGGDVNLSFLFDRLFEPEPGSGYPEHRKEAQADSRERLRAVSAAAHRPMREILLSLDRRLVVETLAFPGMKDLLTQAELKDEPLADTIHGLYQMIEEGT